MGGAVSAGQDNDELIDNLVQADYIRSHLVEKVFRAVDRGAYFLPDSRTNAYKDLAWKSGNVHLSAPCIYSEVMEGLKMRPGLSFLNLGSGTGYLCTMVGLILGSNGINHGVELYEDVVQYAYKKLDEFKKYSGAIDEYDFCEPKFIQGNCLCLSSDTRQYDRVYCGAACPVPHENYMKNLIKVGGILVMPLNDQLLQIKRTSETTWDVYSLLPVSFAGLIQPHEEKQELITMMEVEPLALQALCRISVRNILRKNIEHEYPNLKSEPWTKKAPKKKRALRRLVVPLFDNSDDSSDEDHPRHRDFGRVNTENRTNENNNQVSTLIDFVLGRLRDRRNNETTAQRWIRDEIRNELTNSSDGDGERSEAAGTTDEQNRDDEEQTLSSNNKFEDQTQSCEENIDRDDGQGVSGSQTQNRNEEDLDSLIKWHDSESDNKNQEPEKMDIDNENRPETSSRSTEVQAVIEHPQEANSPSDDEHYGRYNGVDVINGIQEVIVGVLNELRGERGERDGDINEEAEEQEEEEEEVDVQKASTSLAETESPESATKPKNKREKFDSGLGDEIIEKDNITISPDISDSENVMEVDSCSSSGETPDERRTKRGSKSDNDARTGGKWRRITLYKLDSASSTENEIVQDVSKISPEEVGTVASPYTPLMKSKIQQLPLPPALKNYLNFYREF